MNRLSFLVSDTTDRFLYGPYRRIKWFLIHIYDFCRYIPCAWNSSRGESTYNLLHMLNFKFTKMGVYCFTKPYPNKEIAHKIWEVRKALRKYTSDSAEEDAQKLYEMMFFKEFGVPIPHFTFTTELLDGRDILKRTYEFPPEYMENEKKAMEEWLDNWANYKLRIDHYLSLESAYKKDFFNKFEKYLDDWWD